MEKLNIAEILRHCPKGMELDCTMFDNVTFIGVNSSRKQFPIEIAISGQRSKYLTKEGCFHDSTLCPEAKCVIFPKGKTTWEGFQKPFKDGDIVFYNDTIAIFKEWGDETLFKTYVTKYLCCDSLIDTNVPLFGKGIRREARFATEKEKQKLFKAIKDNGYKWNPKTKTLEKVIEPKFKVGDWIEFKYYERKPEKVIRIKDNVYYLSSGDTLMFQDEHAWDLTTKKFDITTLKPFDKVLVRCGNNAWHIQFFEKYDKRLNYPFVCMCYNKYRQCIPYKDNQHLLGTTNDCDDYFKTWE